MSYIQKSLGADEDIKGIFPLHWIAMVNVYILWVVSLFLFAIFDAGFYSILWFLPAIYWHLRTINIEYGVTSKRVVHKKGIIARKTEEQLLAKVETVEIIQSIIGRLFDYGSVKVSGTGSSSMVFKYVDNPIEVKRQVEELL